MSHGKRIHRIAISLDDEELCILSLLAQSERKVLSDCVYEIVREKLFGAAERLKPTAECVDQKRCYGE